MQPPAYKGGDGQAFRQWMTIVALFAIAGGAIGGSIQSHMDATQMIARLRGIEASVKSAPSGGGRGDEGEKPDPQAVNSVIRPADAVRGPSNAPVTIVEFSDFQCPFCRRFVEGAYEPIFKEYGNKVRMIFKQLPLKRIHPDAENAAIASECANRQGKFWQYHDVIFANQRTLGVEALIKYGQEAGVPDQTAFAKCVRNRETLSKVNQDLDDAMKLKVNGTPAFFINGRELSGAQPFEVFKEGIDAALNDGD